MPRLIATKEFKYADVVRRVGDAFDASDEDARLLKGWDKARDAKQGSAPGYQTKVQEAGDSLPLDDESSTDRPRRKYRRRDMVAEG